MTLPNELQGVLAEMDAQGAAKRAVEGHTSPEEARLAIQGALDLAADPLTFSAAIEQAAMKTILGLPIGPEPYPSPDATTETRLFEQTALLWLTWLRGEAPRARELCAALRRQAAQGGPLASGAVHRKTLLFWLEAIDLLLQEERAASRRLWRHALDVGSSFGTESHPTILWSYIATFFPTEGPGSFTERGSLGRSFRQADPRG